MKKHAFFSIILLLFTFLASSNSFADQNLPFSKGVNLTGWFQVDNAQQIQFTKYTREDFEQIKSLGCDVVRLPINLHFMTNGAPNYTLDPMFLHFLDQVVDWTEELNIHLIMDNHTFDSSTDTDPKVGDILLKVWPQMAAHYKERSNLIYYEILNEPHGIADALWNSTQKSVIDAIRKIDTKHTLVVGPAGWNSYNNLADMPITPDTNLIYTFHFYDPFMFTHQGAGWTDMVDLSEIPFPYSSEKMPEIPASIRGTWVENTFKDYKNKGTIAEVQRLIDIAVKFQQTRNVPIFCGEFGVYDVVSPEEDRVYWYNVVRNYLEEKNIAWTIWDYHGGFGIYEKNSDGMFYHNLNVPMAEALGLTPPEQTPYIALPDSVGFSIFSDYSGENIDNTSYVAGVLNFYSTDRPNNGDYCIQWSGGKQYQSISFNFSPNKDLSKLVENNFALDLFVRGDDPNGSFDIRFIDTKTDETDHPWRNRVVIDKKMVKWNGIWEHLHIPLKNFTEQGSWDNAWFNPAGQFDWKAIDRLEIVTESKAMSAGSLWVDNIFITELDTAQVLNTTPDTTHVDNPDGVKHIQQNEKVFANFSYSSASKTLTISSTNDQNISFQLVDLNGRVRIKGENFSSKLFDLSQLPIGTYIVTLFDERKQLLKKRLLVY